MQNFLPVAESHPTTFGSSANSTMFLIKYMPDILNTLSTQKNRHILKMQKLEE